MKNECLYWIAEAILYPVTRIQVSFFARNLQVLAISQIVMEILGIVWAASIICPASAAAKSTQGICAQRTQQHESLLAEPPAQWRRSLQGLVDWVTILEPQGELGTSATVASPAGFSWWFSTIEPDDEHFSEPPSFQTLMPAIGSALTSFEPPAELAAAAPESASESTGISHRWHSWSAVAAVRVERGADAALAVDGPTHDSDQCLQSAAATYQPSALAMKASPKVQIWVHNQFVGEVAGQVAAQKIATKLRTLVKSGQLEPTNIIPLVGENFVGVSHQDEVLFLVDETLQPHPEVPATVTAAQWANNLRAAFNATPIGLAEVQMAIEGLSETPETLYGTASWYGPKFHGRQTANGEIFDENALTAAHKTLPFNTQLKVTNRMNGRSVVVRINDRGPYIGQRSLDLSKAAARCLGSTQPGVVPYEAVILESTPLPDLGEVTTAQLPSE